MESIEPLVGRVDVILVLVVILLLTFKTFWSRIFYKKFLPPGPIGLPVLGYLPFLGKEPYKVLWKLKEKYGDVFSINIGQDYTVILSDYKLAKEVLTNPACLDRSTKMFGHMPESGILDLNGQVWSDQRRVFMSSARDLGLGKGRWENYLFDGISKYIQHLNETNAQPTDVIHSTQYSLAANTIHLLIGRTLRKDESDKLELSMKHSRILLKFTGSTNLATLFPGVRKLWEILKIWDYDEAAEVAKDFFAFLRKEVHYHDVSSEYKDEKDFINLFREKWSELLKSKTENHVSSDGMILGNMNALFLGSTDTILNTLLWAMRLLAKYKHVQTKMYEELMDVFGIDGKPSWGDRDKIPYTYATILEVWRHASILPIPGPRQTTADIEINGYIIPKGSDVITNVWGIHHNPEIWDKPNDFIPERFFGEGGTKVNPNPYGFLAFTIGKRGCPGRTIAEMTLLAYTTEIVKNFEITSEPGVEIHFETVRSQIRSLKPQKLCFRRRNQA